MQLLSDFSEQCHLRYREEINEADKRRQEEEQGDDDEKEEKEGQIQDRALFVYHLST